LQFFALDDDSSIESCLDLIAELNQLRQIQFAEVERRFAIGV